MKNFTFINYLALSFILILVGCNEAEVGPLSKVNIGSSIPDETPDNEPEFFEEDRDDDNKLPQDRAVVPIDEEPVEPVCVPGKRIALYVHRGQASSDQCMGPARFPQGTNSHQAECYYNTRLGAITTFSGELSAINNYDYHSWSAHTKIGPSPSPFASQVFFYQGADEKLTLFMVHNIDSNDRSSGSADNKVKWDILSSGNSSADNVILSDDRHELKLKPNRGWMRDNEQLFKGNWHYWYNTDGGVLGPYNGEDFEIRIRSNHSGDISAAAFYSADGSVLNLMNEGEVSSFLLKYEDYETCE